MRILTIGLLTATALVCASAVHAADLDYDVLRGAEYEPPAPLVDWGGVYVGGHGGYSSSALGFRNVFQPIVANALRATVIEEEMGVSSLLVTRDVRVSGASYGAYAGYNWQFENTVVGVEFDYTRFDVNGVSSDAIGRSQTTSDGFLNNVNLSGVTSTKLEDYGTIRARAGYALGSFLPFVTAGVAIGRAEITDRVGIQAYGYDQAAYKANQQSPTTPTYINYYGYSYFDQSNPAAGVPAVADRYERSKTKVVAGVALGGGLEYAITSNFLLRGEYQYVLFNDFDGHKVNVNTVRGGAAYKF